MIDILKLLKEPASTKFSNRYWKVGDRFQIKEFPHIYEITEIEQDIIRYQVTNPELHTVANSSATWKLLDTYIINKLK